MTRGNSVGGPVPARDTAPFARAPLRIGWYNTAEGRLARPALFTVALFQFLFSWNDFLGPLIYLNDQSKFTLALGLANMQSAIGLSDFGMIMAAAVFTVAPVMLLFIFAQRYFIEGIVRSRAT